MQEVAMTELALMVLEWVMLLLNSNSNLIMVSMEGTTTLVDLFVKLVEELQEQVTVLLVVLLLVTLVVAASPHPLNQLHVHDSDDILNHWRVCISYYSLVLDIPREPVK